MMMRLHKREPLPEAHLTAAMSLDSRSLSNLLKELSKNGADARAAELFDCIRSLHHAPRELLDVYSFTAMICSCIHRQDVDRAMELIEDMKSRGIAPNVHTFTALMNVQIKCGKLHKALQTYESMRTSGCQPNVVTYK